MKLIQVDFSHRILMNYANEREPINITSIISTYLQNTIPIIN